MNEEQKQLSIRYLLYTALTSTWFTAAIWLLYFRHFVSDGQIGLLDSLGLAIGLIAEVPSGALADRYGRDKMVRLGQLFAAMGLLFQTFGSGFVTLFAGQAVLMVGLAFVSGADSALFYENLNFDKKTRRWRKLVTRGTQVALAASLVSYVGGGIAYTINMRLPTLITAVIFLFSILVIWPVKDRREPQARRDVRDALRHYFKDIKGGFVSFMNPQLRLYIPIIIGIQGLFYAYGFGMLRPVLLDRFGFSAFEGGVVLAICGLITIGTQQYLHKNAEKVSEKHGLLVVGLAAVTGLLVSILPLGQWGIFVILMLYVGEYAIYAFMSEAVHNHASSDQRATVLSVASFFKALPYVVLAPTIGVLSSVGHLEYFFISWSALVVVALVYYLAHKKRDDALEFSEDIGQNH